MNLNSPQSSLSMGERAKSLLQKFKGKNIPEKSKKIVEDFLKQSEQDEKNHLKKIRDRSNSANIDMFRNLFEKLKEIGQTKAEILGKREKLLRQSFSNDQEEINRFRPLFDKILNEVYGGTNGDTSAKKGSRQQQAFESLSEQQREDIKHDLAYAIYQDFVAMQDIGVDRQDALKHIQTYKEAQKLTGISSEETKKIYEDAFKKVYGGEIKKSPETTENQTDNSSDGSGDNGSNHLTEGERHNSITLELVDIEPYLDLFADQLAMSDYDQKMENISKEGFFKRIAKRSVHRMGRGAYIQSQKEEIKREVRKQLQEGNLKKDDIIAFIRESDNAIMSQNYLDCETTDRITIEDQHTKEIIHDIIDAPDASIRKEKLSQLKSQLEIRYGALLSTDQIDASLSRVQNALNQVDIQSVDIGLQFFDIGRMGNERGEYSLEKQVPSSPISRWLNKLDAKIGNAGPIASRISGVLRHPVTAAIAATAATTSMTFSFNSLTKALTFGLMPGSFIGGAFAAQRSKREEMDRQVLLAREDSHSSKRSAHEKRKQDHDKLNEGIHRYPISEMYTTIIDRSKSREERQEMALLYLAKRMSTKDTGINWIEYDAEGSPTSQNTKIMMAIISSDLGGRNWYKEPRFVEKIEQIKAELDANGEEIYQKREKMARSYGNKEGMKFAARGYLFGLGVGGVVAGIQSLIHETIGSATSGASLIQTPTTSTGISNTHISALPSTSSPTPIAGGIHRVWLDNGTAKYDGNELRVLKTASGEYDIAKMFGHASSHSNVSHLMDGVNLVNNNIMGLVTVNGQVYEVAIQPNGILAPDVAFADIFKNQSFDNLEIAQKVGNEYHIFATVHGNGDGVLSVPQDVSVPVPTPIPTPIPTPTVSWYDKLNFLTLPFGWNKYHETKANKHSKEPRSMNEPTDPEPMLPETRTGKPWDPNSPFPRPPYLDRDKDPRYQASKDSSQKKNSITKILGRVKDGKGFPKAPYLDGSIDPRNKIPSASVAISSTQDPIDSSVILQANEQDIRTKLDELFGRRRDFYNNSGKEGPHASRSRDIFQLDEKILGLQEELSALGVKDIPTWDEYLKKNTVGPISKSIKKDENHTDITSDKTPEKDINTLYGDRISKLIVSGDVVRDKTGIPRIGFIDSNRPYIVMKTKNGMAVPFYRSSQGTSGKEAGKWFPFFGLSQSAWIIKGTVKQMNQNYLSPEIKQLSKRVNETLDYPHSIDMDNMRKSHPFDPFDIRKSKYNSYGIPVLKTPKPTDEMDKNVLPYIQEYIDRIDSISSGAISAGIVPNLINASGTDDSKKSTKNTLSSLEIPSNTKSPQVLNFEAQIKENIAKIGVVGRKTAERFNREILGDIAELEGRSIDKYSLDEQGNVMRK